MVAADLSVGPNGLCNPARVPLTPLLPPDPDHVQLGMVAGFEPPLYPGALEKDVALTEKSPFTTTLAALMDPAERASDAPAVIA